MMRFAAAWCGRVSRWLAPLAGCVLLLRLLAPLPAAAADLLPADLFFKRPTVQELTLSPSGRRLAVTTELQGRVGLFVIDLQAPQARPGVAALFSDADVVDFSWVDDERLVFSVIDLQAGLGKDYRVAPGLYAVRFDGSELRGLIERYGRQFIRSADNTRTLPWNHVLLHVPAVSEDAAGAHADEVIVGEMQYRGQERDHLQPVWLNTRTGRTRSLGAGRYPKHVERWWFSAQGRPRAVLTSTEGREALYWYRSGVEGQDGSWVMLAEAPMTRLPFLPLWVGDDEAMVVSLNAGEAGERVVAPFDFARGQAGKPLVVTPGFDFAGQVLGDREGRSVLGVRVETDAEQTVWFDPVRKALQQQVDAALPGRVNRISCRRCGAADAVVLVRSWSDQQPGQLLLLKPGDRDGQGSWSVVSTLQPGIDPRRMARLDLERIRARDGHDLPLWVTRPADLQPGQPRPAVVMVHGGPWVRGGHWGWHPMAQFLASRGYVVIEPEFRGSDGYGARHRMAGDRQWGQAMQDDVADALRWAQAQKIASDKACIFGASYGGYSTLMGLINDPDLYRCGSAWAAVTDLMLFLEGGWFVADDITSTGRRYFLPDRVGDATRDREMLLAHSPVEQAQRIRAPLQLIYGTDDLRVPIDHGKRLRSAMRKAGLEPEWIEYEGEAHGLRKTDNKVDMALKLEAFLARYLK